MTIAAVCLALVVLSADEASKDLLVQDIFGRTLNERGLVLVDWEGHIANPVIRFTVLTPEDAILPAKMVLKAKEPRLYFDLPSTASEHGPRKEFLFQERARAAAAVAIFPDRDHLDENHALEIELTDAGGRRFSMNLPVHVVDQDPQDWTPAFPIVVDFSQDRTKFFDDDVKRTVVARAANDWAFFFDDMRLALTPAGAEQTFVWDADGFKTGRYVTNDREYRGFLLYAYGIRGEELRSGGEPSRAGGFQVSGGETLPIRRSGGLEVEVRGNYSEHGWLDRLEDSEWWKATNYSNQQNDLYSIVHHELGHSLIFNPGHTRFEAAKLRGTLREPRIAEFLGRAPAIDRTDHLNGTVDPESLRGAFGNEYHGAVPRGRWLITKTDLLTAQAVGYALRTTSAFVPLTLHLTSLPAGSVAERYSVNLRATGGIPFYHWDVTAGTLPDGLELDAFTGELRGMPRRAGSFEFTVRVRDYREKGQGQSQALAVRIR